ncbi:hypothetical protein M426DRAFT_322236 [Hypoxylon sp. CI-4A]|nr:hypothetical protein M426DRAFT_322236 [Hypoxylon sp. CI-4A]
MTAQHVFSSFLVSPKELSEALKQHQHPTNPATQRIIPLCGAWFLPTDSRKGIDSFKSKHIPNARFFDLDKVADPNTPLPNMLPSASDFAAAMSDLGIRPADVVVVYDSHELGIFSAPRVAWTFQVFGHRNVHVLNNFRLWVDGGYPTESGDWESVSASIYPVPIKDESKIISFEELKDHFLSVGAEIHSRWQVLDTRPAGRWGGKDPEPRPELASGHMPSSINVSLAEVLDLETRAFLSGPELQALFKGKGVNPQQPIITSCMSGITAAVLSVALQVASYGDENNRKLYDGSWREWGERAIPYDGLIVRDGL